MATTRAYNEKGNYTEWHHTDSLAQVLGLRAWVTGAVWVKGNYKGIIVVYFFKKKQTKYAPSKVESSCLYNTLPSIHTLAYTSVGRDDSPHTACSVEREQMKGARHRALHPSASSHHPASSPLPSLRESYCPSSQIRDSSFQDYWLPLR